MGNLKSLTLLALFLSLSLAVYAETSNDVTHAKEDEVKPSEATDAVEPQQRGRGGCRYGCCGAYAFGRCSACCSRSQATEAVAETEVNDAKVEANDAVVEPQQIWGCRFGCCGGWVFGQCRFCCRSPQAQAEAVEAVEPQQRGGCRYGCCGQWRYGRCSYCCRGSQAESEVVEPQQRGCRYGCCGSYANGQCSACCSKKMAMENEEAKP